MKNKSYFKVLFIILFSVHFFPKAIQSQNSWYSINGSQNSIEDINGLDIVNSNVIYAVGGGGFVYKSVDAGNNWDRIVNNATSQYLWSVSFADEQTGWAVGYGGTIVKTINGGTSWQIQNSGIYTGLIDVQFIDQMTGWAAGHDGIVLKTINGGLNWIPQTTGNMENIFDIKFINSMTGYFSGDGGVYKTTNGGADWTNILDEPWIYSVDFINANTGWAGVRFGKMFKTIDGGESWTEQNSGTGATYYSTKFLNENTGYSVGDYNTIIKTTNSGINWIKENSGVENNFAKFSRIDTYDESGNNCFIVGFNNVILKTENGGANWENYYNTTNSSIPGNIDLWSIFFTSNDVGWTAGSNGSIYKTTNGGLQWNISGQGLVNDLLIDIYFSGDKHGWFVGHNGKILRTSNNGLNWEVQNSGTQENLFNVFFYNNIVGWVAGDNGILKTTNGGLTWEEKLNYQWMYSVYFIDQYTGWAGGRFGKLVKTTDGGNTWTDQQGGTGATYYSLKFSDENNGWAVGDYNTIIRTTNGGTTWSQQNSGIQSSSLKLSEIQIAVDDANTAYISTYENHILKTTNAGQNWYKSTLPGYSNYNSIFFSSASIGYAAGFGASILKTENRGITGIITENNTSPESFLLSQNYPNPFNPKTVIKYNIAYSDKVSLKVYDILGNEVAELVNKKQNAGSYSMEFNGSGFSSGVYFYRLESGNNFDTKRMLLIK